MCHTFIHSHNFRVLSISQYRNHQASGLRDHEPADIADAAIPHRLTRTALLVSHKDNLGGRVRGLGGRFHDGEQH